MHALLAHPDMPPSAGFALLADVVRTDEGLRFQYILTGDVAALKLPPAADPERTDGLWQATCFEAFLRRTGQSGYCEYNFAPSSQWAAYIFTGYRTGMEDITDADPSISVTAFSDRLELTAEISLPDTWQDAELDIALTAVIEERNGTKSYWSLAHPEGAPDFHNDRCFALHLPAVKAP